MSTPFDPITLGAIRCPNRIVMAPLTRARADGGDGRTPNDLMTDYYVQRASAGLILTEATSVTPMGVGYANTPGLWSDAHVRGWRKITTAVHAAFGRIVLQLWHVGRVSHPMFLDGAVPVSASAIAPEGFLKVVRPHTPYVTPRALELTEIPGVVAEYRRAAELAQKAGFDGVEIHGANGYLLEQFLSAQTNQRGDRYGGSLENRARLMLEVTDAVVNVWGADRVGLHLSPRGGVTSRPDADAAATYGYVAAEMGRRRLAFIATREFVGPDSLGPALRKQFGGPLIGNEAYTFASAREALAEERVDAVAFGKDFIANPDLVKRFGLNAPLNRPVPETFYHPGPKGYVDYPFLD